MRAAIGMLPILLLGLSIMPVMASEPPPQVEGVGPLIIVPGNNVSESFINVIYIENQSRPIIAEDYTATWCENCVGAEHALDEVDEEQNLLQLHFHPDQDGQDPFGTAEGDAWWERRYGERLAPTIVFSGLYKHLGTSPTSDSLKEDYTISANTSLELGEGHLNFSWTPENDTALVTWLIDADDMFPNHAGHTIEVYVFIVEESAYFPNGSNGIMNYPHIVTQITPLGNRSSGEEYITIPSAYDGDDLRAHLVVELVPPPQVNEDMITGQSSNLDELWLFSGIGILSFVFILLIILTLRNRGKNTSEPMTEVVTDSPTRQKPTDISPQQLQYEKQMIELGWDPVKAREYAEQQFSAQLD